MVLAIDLHNSKCRAIAERPIPSRTPLRIVQVEARTRFLHYVTDMAPAVPKTLQTHGNVDINGIYRSEVAQDIFGIHANALTLANASTFIYCSNKVFQNIGQFKNVSNGGSNRKNSLQITKLKIKLWWSYIREGLSGHFMLQNIIARSHSNILRHKMSRYTFPYFEVVYHSGHYCESHRKKPPSGGASIYLNLRPFHPPRPVSARQTFCYTVSPLGRVLKRIVGNFFEKFVNRRVWKLFLGIPVRKPPSVAVINANTNLPLLSSSL